MCHTHIQQYITPPIFAMRMWRADILVNVDQAALNVSGLGDSYHILHTLLCSATEHEKSLGKGPKKSDMDMLDMEHVAQAAAHLGANIASLDLNKVLEEVQNSMPYLQSIAPERDFEAQANQVQVWRLMASSASFRKAIIDMEINQPLCDFMGSMFKEVLTESEAIALVRGCRRREIEEGAILFDDTSGQSSVYWTLIISGNVTVSQVASFFGLIVLTVIGRCRSLFCH